MCVEEGLLLVDEGGKFLWANFQASELLGYQHEEFKVGSLGSTGPIVESIAAMLAGNLRHAEGEARLPKVGGERLGVRWNLWALPPRSGCAEFLLSISRVPRPVAEPFAADGFHDIFEFAVGGVFRATVEGRFFEVNPALIANFGFAEPAEFLAFVAEEGERIYVDPARRAEFLERMLSDGFVEDFEVQMRARGESTVWAALFARTVRSANGEPLFLEGSLVDITERKHTENALRWSEDRFRRLAETTRVVPFEYDLVAQVFRYIGPQAESLFGSEFRRGLSYARWCELVHPEDLKAATRFAHEAALAEAGEFHTEFRLGPNLASTEVWMKQTVHRADIEGKGRHVRGFLFEVTESKRAEMERERSRAQLRELAAQAHLVREEERITVAREIHDELGQTLTLLKMDLGRLIGPLASLGDDERTQPLLEKIGSMEQLIQWTLQSMRRILSSLRPPLLDEVGLKEALEFHLESFCKRAAIRHQWNAAPIPVLSVNTATAVFRIFQEILTNVARHANASRLRVSLRPCEGSVVLKVQDNGCGITQETSSRSRGFGLLGMQERAWAIGGELEIQGSSRSGTTVTLKVPVISDAGHGMYDRPDGQHFVRSGYPDRVHNPQTEPMSR